MKDFVAEKQDRIIEKQEEESNGTKEGNQAR